MLLRQVWGLAAQLRILCSRGAIAAVAGALACGYELRWDCGRACQTELSAALRNAVCPHICTPATDPHHT